jgi:hypothetical protein
MDSDTRLLRKGMKVSLTGLLDQAKAHLGLEARHRAKLAARGWTPELTKALVDGVAALEGERARSIDARSLSKANLEREHQAVGRVKALKKALDRAVDDLYAEQRVAADVRATLRGRGAGRLGRSTPRLLAYLVDAEPQVRALDKLLTPYFEGQSPHKEILGAKAELEAAQRDQEVNYAALPEETQKVYRAKAQVLSLIEKLNRLGKLAFEATPAAARFNQDLIARARRKRLEVGVEEKEAAEAEAEG